ARNARPVRGRAGGVSRRPLRGGARVVRSGARTRAGRPVQRSLHSAARPARENADAAGLGWGLAVRREVARRRTAPAGPLAVAGALEGSGPAERRALHAP